MSSLSVDWPRPEVLVDAWSQQLWDPASDSVVGFSGPLTRGRVAYALPDFGNGGISQRYSPKPVSESSTFGLDLSAVVPKGVGIVSGTLSIFTNVVSPVAADSDFTKGAAAVVGRAVFAALGGGVVGKDYLLRWLVVDTAGNTWERTALLLCAPTS